MLRDRGTIKWTALMLPEHVELLKKMWQEDQKVDMPILDEQELEWLNRQLIKAFQLELGVKLTIHEDDMMKEYCGKITALNKDSSTIHLLTQNHTTKKIPLLNIISIN